MSRTCPGCGATLPAAACPVCVELGHLDYLLDSLRQWRGRNVPSAQLLLMLREYEARRDEVLGVHLDFELPPAATTPPAQPAPPPEPEPEPGPAEPDEWTVFRQATNLSWIYGVSVLFVTAGLLWLIAISSNTPWGKSIQATVVSLLAVAALRGGWWTYQGLGLRRGGQAVLAIGVLLTPLALYAIELALGGTGGPEFACVIWGLTAVLAALIAGRLRLPSQVALANLSAAMSLFWAALWLSTGTPHGELLGVLYGPLAGGNLWWAWRERRAAQQDEATAEMVHAARVSAVVLVVIASLALLGALPRLFDPALVVTETLAPLLLCAVLIAMAYELETPGLIAVGALAWYLAMLTLGYGLFQRPAFGEWIGVMGLLGAAMATGGKRDEYTPWWAGTAGAAAAIVLLPRLPWLLSDRLSPYSAASAWTIALAYAGMGYVWQRRSPLSAAVVAATIATLFTAKVTGHAASWHPGWLAGLAAVVMVLGHRARELEWDAVSIGQHLRRLALVPLIVGLLLGAGVAVEPGYSPELVTGLLLLAGLSAWLSYQVPNRNVLYHSLLSVGLAVLLLGDVIPWEIDILVGCAVFAFIVGAAALCGNDHLQPLELSGTVLMVLAVAGLVLRQLDQPVGFDDLSAMLLATLFFTVPALPPLRSRSHCPELVNSEFRPWMAVLALVSAEAMATELSGWTGTPGMAAAGLMVVLVWRLVPDTGRWGHALRFGGAGAAALATLAAASDPGCPSWVGVAILGQVALVVAAADLDGLYVLGALAWHGAWFIRLEPELQPPYLDHWLGCCALQYAVAVAYLSQTRRSAAAVAAGLLAAATAHLYLGWSRASEHWPLWFGAYALAAALLGLWYHRRGLTEAAQVAVGIAVMAAIGTVASAMIDEDVTSVLALLGCYTAFSTALTCCGLVHPGWPVGLGNLALVYACWYLRTPLEHAQQAYGLRLAFLALANSGLAVGLRGWERWRDALLLGTGTVAALSALLMLVPPERPSVFGFLVLCAASCTVAWLRDETACYDLGFVCAWLSMVIVLVDAANKGRDELAPYRSLDLYAVPIGIYLQLIADRRKAEPRLLRLTGVGVALLSLLLSALVAASPLHDAALFIAVLAAVVYGARRDDLQLSLSGYVAAAIYALAEIWRWQTGGRYLLMTLLVVLGVGALAYALRQERAAKD